MMKIVALLVVLCASVLADDMKCEGGKPNVPEDWIDMEQECIKEMRRQIQKEVDASYIYMAMGAHFSRDDVNRPGFAKHFFESSTEERSHAIALIEYLMMRGPEKLEKKFVTDLIETPKVEKHVWENGVEALKDALNTEAAVTRSIRQVIKTCEATSLNDYHLVDYLTGEFLEEQYKGQRHLAGMISTLDKMMKNSGALGEFLFDKTLL